MDRSLIALEKLAEVYDGGFSPIAFNIAVEIQKLLTENRIAVQARGDKVFRTPDQGDETRMLNALHKLTMVRFGGEPPVIDFMPIFASGDSFPSKMLPFRDWWNRDVIYRASAALPGTPAGMIPVNDSPSVPFEKREKLSRRELIMMVRNKIGAHHEADFPVLLDELNDHKGWGSFAMTTPDGDYSTDDGTLQTGIQIIPAMIRQICQEVLEAYGRA